MSNPEALNDDVQWVEHIRRGDEAAFEALFYTYYEALVDFTRRQIGNAVAAEDIVQDLFLSLWRRRGTWQLEGSLKAYLYGAVRNKVITHRKHRQVVRRWQEQAQRQEVPSHGGPVEAYHTKALDEAVSRAIDELPERRRLIFILSRRHGLSNAEIATALDLSVSTVKVQIWHAMKQLRSRLADYLAVSG